MFQSMSKERRNIHEAAAMVTLEDSKSTCWVIYSVAAIFPEVPVVKSAACRFHAVWSLVAELDMEVGRERERGSVFSSIVPSVTGRLKTPKFLLFLR